MLFALALVPVVVLLVLLNDYPELGNRSGVMIEAGASRIGASGLK